MRAVWMTIAVLVLMVVAARSVAMLPPETFKDPIFASESSSDDGGGSPERTDFA